MDSKAWYASRTLWGVIISVLGKAVAGIWGVEITEEDTVQVADAVTLVISTSVSFVGDMLAFYGRLKAKKTIGKKPA
jgi:hypothetical protein